MRRTIVLLLATLLLAGCLKPEHTCESARADVCHDMRGAQLIETGLLVGNSSSTWFARFAAPDEPSRELEVSCEAEDLAECARVFNMPDLDRLPHGEAKMKTDSSSVESIRGTFRVDQVTGPLSNGASYRFVGLIEELVFEPDGESIAFVGGEFDIVSSPVGE